ncbi:MAG: c-type cytochrome domain-containing protein [Roseibacillus sp.]
MKSIYISIFCALLSVTAGFAQPGGAAVPTLEEVKATGALRSSYRKQVQQIKLHEAPLANLNVFRKEIEPLLRETCFQCHGPKKQKGKFRVDTLDPDLLHGGDVDWWLEVYDVLSNGEMPPEDSKYELADADRSKMIDWLASEIQTASQVRRRSQEHE